MPGVMSGISQFMGGAMGNSGAPYEKAGNAYNGAMDKYFPGAQSYLNPYSQGGANAFNNQANALNKMSDPNAFMDSIMSKYEESPWAAFERKYGNKGMINQNSASGMMGSGAALKASADYNQGLTSRDMQTYLNNILGINQQYLSGQSDMAHVGAGAAGQQSSQEAQMARDRADMDAQTAYGKQAGENRDRSDMWGGLANAGLSFFGF